MITKYIVGGLGIVILLMAGSIWALMQSRDSLLEENAEKAQALSSAAKANTENLSTIKSLEADIAWREAKAIERQQRNQNMEVELAATRDELEKAMKDAPECVDQPWPDAVLDIMRRGTVADPNRGSAGEGADQLLAADTDTGATAVD